ncbi:hypothetical protein [Sphingosinicella sp.]|uniref:hypothetical protein n=1 Tax=Sphingosinicella sp. TaxID=1917971 RepID=UPI004037CFC0
MTDTTSPFNVKVVFGLIAAAVIAFGALLVLLAYTEEPGAPGGDGRAAPSRSAVGYAGLVQLAGRFTEARVVRGSDGVDSEDLLVVALTGRGGPAAVTELLNRRGGRATLLIVPKWLVERDRSHPGWVRAIAPTLGARAAPLLGEDVSIAQVGQSPGDAAQGEGFLEGLVLPAPPQVQAIVAGLTPLATLPADGALLAQIGEQPHFVLAEPDLVNNHGLRDPARARAAIRLLTALSPTGATGINFDLETNGQGGRRPDTPSLLQLAFEPPLLAMTLALLFAALLAGFYGAFRFGPARREQRAIAFGKAALVENSAGLIRLAKREARLGGAYADVVRTEAARITGAPAWLGGERLDAYLDRLGRAGETRFTQLAAAVSAATDRASLMAAARALHEWRRGLVK